MMGRWGLEGMRSFQQASVSRKEGARLRNLDSTADKEITNENESRDGPVAGVLAA